MTENEKVCSADRVDEWAGLAGKPASGVGGAWRVVGRGRAEG